MNLSTAFKISGICLMALAAEALLAYMIFSNYAFSMAESGRYNVREAYASGPMATAAKIFYIVFGVTIAIGVTAPIVAVLSMIFKRGSDSR